MQLVLTLPLPPKGLRPNDRSPWMVKAGLTRTAREQGRRAMFTASKLIESTEWIVKSLHFKAYFKTARHWDANAIESGAKAYEDGIADTCRQDDKTFEHTGVSRFTDKENPRLEVVLKIEELI